MDIIQIKEWIKILEPVGSLTLVIFSGLMILILWHRLKPWLEFQDRKTVEKKQRIEKLKQNLKEARSDETRKKASTEFWKLVAVDGIQIVLLIIVFVLIIVLFPKAIKYFENNFENNLWETKNEMVQMIDESKHRLYLRTVREPLDPICVGEKKRSIQENDQCIQYWERENEILNRQSLCRLKALLESFKYQNTIDDITNITITNFTYQVCMMEEGWHTEQCSEEEKDCVELQYAESTCTGLTRDWLNDGGSDTIVTLCKESKSWLLR